MMATYIPSPPNSRKSKKFDRMDPSRGQRLAVREAEIRRLLEIDKPRKKREHAA